MQQIAEGKYTDTVYTWIQQEQWHDAISLLSYQLKLSPRSRAGLSLLAYCQFQIEKYEEAAPLYETLAQLFHEKQSYRYSHALCLYRLGDLETCKDVLRGLSGMEKEKAQLLANIALLLDDRAQVKTKLQAMEEDETEARVTKGCLLFAEGKYVEAKELFDATFKGTFLPQQAYNSALCAFRLKRYGEALKLIALVIENGIRNYPDLGVGSYLDDGDVRPVGNSVALRESALIESLNLKAAIEYTMKNVDQAQEVLKDLPPRAEEDVDAITLHNQALIYFNQDPTSGLKKLNHLLLNPPHPPETFLNLLLLYCKPGIGRFNLVADMMAENPEMVSTHLSRDKEGLLRALITQQDSPSSAYGAWERLAEDYVQRLRIVTKRIQSCRTNNDDAGVKKAVQVRGLRRATMKSRVRVQAVTPFSYWFYDTKLFFYYVVSFDFCRRYLDSRPIVVTCTIPLIFLTPAAFVRFFLVGLRRDIGAVHAGRDGYGADSLGCGELGGGGEGLQTEC